MISTVSEYWLENSEKAPGGVGIAMNLGGEEGIVGKGMDMGGVLMSCLPPLCPPGHFAPGVGGFWHLVEQESTVLVQTPSP